MKRAVMIALGTVAVISSAAAIGVGIEAAATFAPQGLSRAEYGNALAAVEADREQVLARCEDVVEAQRELCRVEAGADEMVRAAEIEANFRRTQDAARAAQRARVEARYLVERARCASLGGAKRDRCLIAAHAERGATLMEVAAPYESRT